MDATPLRVVQAPTPDDTGRILARIEHSLGSFEGRIAVLEGRMAKLEMETQTVLGAITSRLASTKNILSRINRVRDEMQEISERFRAMVREQLTK